MRITRPHVHALRENFELLAGAVFSARQTIDAAGERYPMVNPEQLLDVIEACEALLETCQAHHLTARARALRAEPFEDAIARELTATGASS